MQTLHFDEQNWQQLLAGAITDYEELCRILHITPAQLPLPESVLRNFPLRVPRPYLSRIKRGNPLDPLLLQILPNPLEAAPMDGYGEDPVGDDAATRLPGLLHKYRGRVLLIVTGACAIHCRYCFRRHFPYSDNMLRREQWRQVLDTLAADESVTEVILSGGDPLNLSDHKLANIASDLTRIPHLQTLRLHTRLPVVLPQRVQAGLIQALAGFDRNKVMVIHANHPAELDKPVQSALQQLRFSGITLLNQSVLLRGVNDEASVLAQLSRRLFSCGVLPYYLHQLDRVAGAAHFAVTKEKTRLLMREISTTLPGYLLPRLVEERAGDPGKRLIPY